MANENENLNSSNEKFPIQDLENLSGDALKEKLKEFGDKYDKTLDANRQLFTRAKRAEGFEQNEKGDWIKIQERKSEAHPKESKKSDEFGLLEKAFLRSAGILDTDEVELLRKWQEDTKKPIDELVDHPFVKLELEKLRQTKANANATSNIKGDGGSSGGAKDTPEYWIEKGEVPERTPENRELRIKIARMLMKKEKEGKKFYND